MTEKGQLTFSEIIARATALGLPITEFAFYGTRKNPVPEPPFIIYLKTEHARGHDKGNAIVEIEGSIELYTDRAPETAWETRIEEEVLYDIEYDKQQAEIKSERMVQTAYEFTTIEKKG